MACDWEPKIRNGMPILQCGNCRRIWWPDQFQPKSPCKAPVRFRASEEPTDA